MADESSLHGSAPDSAPVALLLIDVINAMSFPGGAQLLEQAMPMAHALRELKRRARAAGVPCLYVNDNFGRWRSDLGQITAHVLEADAPGRPVAELLRPDEDDYFVLKPRHSGFFSTTLELLLQHLDTQTLILTGVATNNCVLATATDAYMRGYRLIVPPDCVAAESRALGDAALAHMADVLKAERTPSAGIDFGKLREE